MRLIDADELKIDYGFTWDDITPTHDELYALIDRQPTIKVVPERKKGRWVDCVGSDHWKCSECGDRAPMYWDANRQEYDEWFSPYCPNCGAHMGGE